MSSDTKFVNNNKKQISENQYSQDLVEFEVENQIQDSQNQFYQDFTEMKIDNQNQIQPKEETIKDKLIQQIRNFNLSNELNKPNITESIIGLINNNNFDEEQMKVFSSLLKEIENLSSKIEENKSPIIQNQQQKNDLIKIFFSLSIDYLQAFRDGILTKKKLKLPKYSSNDSDFNPLDILHVCILTTSMICNISSDKTIEEYQKRILDMNIDKSKNLLRVLKFEIEKLQKNEQKHSIVKHSTLNFFKKVKNKIKFNLMMIPTKQHHTKWVSKISIFVKEMKSSFSRN